MKDMSSKRSGSAPDERDKGYWTTETLPLSVRKQLLERELKQLGFRKAGQGGRASEGGTDSNSPQQSEGAGEPHPKAPGDGD